MAKWKICPRCEGEGKSSAYLGAYTAEEFQEAFDAEEQEDYIAGRYDGACEQCGGSGKVNAEQERRWSERREDLRQQWLESGCPEGSFSDWAGV